MKARGVFGGSMLGITFLHASTKVSSAVEAAGKSVEKSRAPAAPPREAKVDLENMRVVIWRNMVGFGIARLARSERMQMNWGRGVSLSFSVN